MSGKLSRTKGHSFERWVAIALRGVFPSARRHLEYQDGECHGYDIANTGWYRIQCKRFKKYANPSHIQEVEADEAFGEVPVLVTKADNERVLAVLPFEEFLDLLRHKYSPPT